MKVLLSILREMADLPDDPAAVESALSALGMAVEEATVVGVPVEGVVTARIVRTEKHPDAAKVTRCWVDAGDGTERHVWCGATNMGTGDVVPLATLGTRMPDGREIARRGILGIDSEGMLCSALELGLGEDSSGLLILDAGTPLGIGVFEALGVESDVVFDLDLTRNRPDCWGHAGVARDLAAHFATSYRGPSVTVAVSGESRTPGVRIEAPDACGRFTATMVSGVRVGPSPAWVRHRLARLGMRPINNIVDASNLVMLETNQPNHAYDASVVGSFSVRRARPGESMVTLDGQRRDLSAEDVLVCTGEGVPVGLAGVMGDEHSEIRDETTDVVLECAWFDPDTVRFAAQRHGLRTEASVRFERGTDPGAWAMSALRFATILAETCPGIVVHEGAAEETSPSCPQPREIALAARSVERLLGTAIPVVDISRILSSIGFENTVDGDVVLARTPTWRPDCTLDVDLVEEVARHWGYERLGKTIPHSTVHGRLSSVQSRRRLLRRVLVGLGLDEAMPNPFLAPGDAESVGLDESETLRIANPLVSDESVLRTSLRPGLLRAVRHNQSHRAPRVALFEIGHVYPRSEASALPAESEHLAVVVAGGDVSTAIEQWLAVSDALGLGALVDQSRVPPGMHPTRSASLTRGKRVLGTVGEMSPRVLAHWGVEGRVSLFELDLSVALADEPRPVQARPINRHPSGDVDVAFVLPDSVPASDLHRVLRQAAGARLVDASLFDVYRGAGVPEGTRSLAFRLRLQEPDATLSEAAIAAVLTACEAAGAKLGATIRRQ